MSVSTPRASDHHGAGCQPIGEAKPFPPPRSLDVWRCSKCNRILARVALSPGSAVEIKCSVCNTFATKEAA